MVAVVGCSNISNNKKSIRQFLTRNHEGGINIFGYINTVVDHLRMLHGGCSAFACGCFVARPCDVVAASSFLSLLPSDRVRCLMRVAAFDDIACSLYLRVCPSRASPVGDRMGYDIALHSFLVPVGNGVIRIAMRLTLSRSRMTECVIEVTMTVDEVTR
eukprot:TRINITY_DN18212_c0_g1_i2.p1 TRINITY_DN18212_c0_g1~~TRINITY_DN18212_c0_g1_i2.p1  ORF type:complete len:159 (-),score=15.87 TRINITY_DN18212_c0_g1_i2:273-749(-)